MTSHAGAVERDARVRGGDVRVREDPDVERQDREEERRLTSRRISDVSVRYKASRYDALLKKKASRYDALLKKLEGSLDALDRHFDRTAKPEISEALAAVMQNMEAVKAAIRRFKGYQAVWRSVPIEFQAPIDPDSHLGAVGSE